MFIHRSVGGRDEMVEREGRVAMAEIEVAPQKGRCDVLGRGVKWDQSIFSKLVFVPSGRAKIEIRSATTVNSDDFGGVHGSEREMN